MRANFGVKSANVCGGRKGRIASGLRDFRSCSGRSACSVDTGLVKLPPPKPASFSQKAGCMMEAREILTALVFEVEWQCYFPKQRHQSLHELMKVKWRGAVVRKTLAGVLT